MLCEIREDDCGNILIDPVNQRRRNALIRELTDQNWSAQFYRDALIFLNHGGETEEYGMEFANKLKGGYRVNVRISEERIRAWLGLP
jgi:hypothetical protein